MSTRGLGQSLAPILGPVSLTRAERTHSCSFYVLYRTLTAAEVLPPKLLLTVMFTGLAIPANFAL